MRETLEIINILKKPYIDTSRVRAGGIAAGREREAL